MSVLGFVEARHLVSRTGIGAEWNEVNRVSKLTLSQAISQLLKQNNQEISTWQNQAIL